MTDRRELEQSLLTEVTRRLAEISEAQHDLARRQRILARAATQLRTGKVTPPSRRPVPRVAASA